MIDTKNNKIGFTIGKFAPLHKGHQYLIEKALEDMDEFIIVIYETDVINIPIEQRTNWIKKLYPNIKILQAFNPPSQYGLDEESVNIQIDYLRKILGNIKTTHFYSSEPYGEFVAKKLNVIDVRIDNKREYNNISATLIRDNLEKCKDYIEEIVYKDCKKYQN